MLRCGCILASSETSQIQQELHKSNAHLDFKGTNFSGVTEVIVRALADFDLDTVKATTTPKKSASWLAVGRFTGQNGTMRAELSFHIINIQDSAELQASIMMTSEAEGVRINNIPSVQVVLCDLCRCVHFHVCMQVRAKVLSTPSFVHSSLSLDPPLDKSETTEAHLTEGTPLTVRVEARDSDNQEIVHANGRQIQINLQTQLDLQTFQLTQVKDGNNTFEATIPGSKITPGLHEVRVESNNLRCCR